MTDWAFGVYHNDERAITGERVRSRRRRRTIPLSALGALECPHFLAIPGKLDQIKLNTRRKRRKRSART